MRHPRAVIALPQRSDRLASRAFARLLSHTRPDAAACAGRGDHHPMKKFFLLRIISCVAGVAAFGVIVGATALQDGGRADVYYRDGARFALEGRLAEAASAFEQAASLDPANGNAYYSLGNVYSEMGRWAD